MWGKDDRMCERIKISGFQPLERGDQGELTLAEQLSKSLTCLLGLVLSTDRYLRHSHESGQDCHRRPSSYCMPTTFLSEFRRYQPENNVFSASPFPAQTSRYLFGSFLRRFVLKVGSGRVCGRWG
jgi:hypothetical protein